MNDQVAGYTEVPYLSTIVTPTKKTKFVYNWWMNPGARATTVVALHEVYECGRDEYPDISTYPNVPTVHYEWNWYDTAVTRYPTSVIPTLTGGITRHYLSVPGPLDDALFKIVDESGNTVVDYGYDYNRNRTSVKDGKGNETKYTFDNNRNIIKVEGPTGTVRHYTYYADNSLHEEKNAAGQVVKSHTYNSAGQLTQVDSPLGTLRINHYDAQGRLDYTEDGRGKRTYYGYDDDGETRGFLTSVTDPENHVTRYRYDGKGRRCEVTDANNNTTSYEYDDLDRITKVTNPDGTFVETHYSCCHLEWVKDENGKMTRYDYDKRNRLWATISAAIDTTLAQSISAADTQIPLASTVGFPTSGGTVLLKSITGDTEIVTYSGISGNVLTGVTRGRFGTTAKAFMTATATEGNITVDVYDEDVKDGNGNYIHRGILDRRIGLYDPNGHLTQFEYYDNGRLKKTTYPDGTWEHYTYDPAGNLVKKEYGHDSVVTKTINYVYDANNRLVGSNDQ
jgi:YD repeat-containing protein